MAEIDGLMEMLVIFYTIFYTPHPHSILMKIDEMIFLPIKLYFDEILHIEGS